MSVTASSTGLASVTFKVTSQTGNPVLSAVSGDGQTGVVGTSLTNPLVVQILDQFQNQFPNRTVTFTVTSGTATVTPTTATTGADGKASVQGTLGTTAGNVTITASSDAGTATFTATAKVGPPATLAIVSGDGQTALAGTAISASVKVTDKYGNVISGVAVQFQVLTGGGSVVGSATTDATGVAATTWTLGTATGANTMSASASGVTAVTFSATATAPSLKAQLSVLPQALTFTAVQGGSNPDPQSAVVSNTGAGTLTFTAASSAAWLSASPASGTAPSSVSVGINISGLAPGSYTGSVTVAAGTATQTVSVSLTVQAAVPAQLVVAPESMVFNATAGLAGALSASLSIRNAGGGTLSWTASADTGGTGSWLSVTPGSGNAPSGATIQVNPAGLAAGQYMGAVTIVAGTQSGAVTVVLNVNAAPELRLSAPVLRFGGQVGGSFDSQSLTASISGGSAVSYSASAEGGNWLSIAGASGTTPGTITVSVNTTGLAAGIYIGAISASSSGARNVAFTTVVLELTAAAAPTIMSASPGGMLIVGTAGGSAVTCPLNLRSNTGASFAWGASASDNWLSVSPASGRGANQLTVSANPAGLKSGIYTGQVAISSSDTANGSLLVNVFLIVKAAGTVSAAAFVAPDSLAATSNILVPTDPAGQFMATAGVPLQIGAVLVDPNGTPITGTQVVVSFNTGEPSITLKDIGGGFYAASWSPMKSGAVVLTYSAAGATSAFVNGTVSAGTVKVPAATTSGAVNGASFKAGLSLAAGSIGTLFGVNLAPDTASAAKTPLATSLLNASLTINGVAAPLFYVSPTQINFQVPYEVAGQTTAALRLTSGGFLLVINDVPLASVSPGIFLVGTTDQGAIIHQDGSLADSKKPAGAGEYLSIYATGLGDVTTPPATGAAASATTLSTTKVKPVVKIGGVAADMVFSGLAPTYVGLYQVNVKVPAGVTGKVPVTVTVGSTVSNIGNIVVQ